jgi:hypothetical protein
MAVKLENMEQIMEKANNDKNDACQDSYPVKKIVKINYPPQLLLMV